MNAKAKFIVLAVVFAALFFLAWVNRYEHVKGISYRDRWTDRRVYLTEDGFMRDPFSAPGKVHGNTPPPDDLSAYAKKAKEEGLTPEEMVICAGKLMEKGLTPEQADAILLGIPLKLTQNDVEDLIKATPVLDKGTPK